LFSKLPISIHKEYKVFSIPGVTVYNEDEICGVASERLQENIKNKYQDTEIISAKHSGSFSEKGYLLHCDMVVSADICKRDYLFE
jgi:hypothetical protein